MNGLALALGKLHFLKAGEPTKRRIRAGFWDKVVLNGFFPITLARVLEFNRCLKRVSSMELFRGQNTVLALKLCITQTVTERVKRFPREIAIRAAFHRIIIDREKLIVTRVKRDTKPSGGIVLPQQSLGEGGAPG